MTAKPKDFLELKDSLYLKAEHRWTWSIILNVLALGGGITSLALQESAKLSASLGLAAILLPAISVVLREAAAMPSDRADAIRQLILFSDSLGKPIPESEQAKVRRWVPTASLKPAPYVAPYYWSRRPPGARRLADNVAESVFFTEHTAEGMIRALSAGAILVLSCLITVIYLVVSLPTPPSSTAIVVKGSITAIAFLLTGDSAVLLWRYVRLKSAAGRVYDLACSQRDDANLTLEEVLPIIQEYESARLQAPPLWRWLHLRNMEEINRDYRESYPSGGVE